MSYKAVVLLCIQFLIKNISSQCIGAPLIPDPVTSPCVDWVFSPAASRGPGMAVSTVSPLIPAGVSVVANTAYEGVLAVGGAVPFLGTVAIEGVLPTAGAGAVAYGCGNGAVGITVEDFGVGLDAIGSSLAVAPLAAGPLGATPLAMGPLAADPLAKGPLVAGPLAMGPLAAGPLAMGPLAAAPLALGPIAAAPYAEPWNANAAVSTLAASNGAGVAVSTVSPLLPAGVSILSDNAYEGTLAAGGALPFLGTVSLEGALPTAGAGAIAYGCGNGAVGITTEDAGAIGFPGALGTGAGINRPMGIAGPACGCGYMY